ncbi:MAG: pilus assembly protein [Hyphomonadaceae bacterium]|nr:pilus assembly protein [Hyphomonadaceae bacterium]
MQNFLKKFGKNKEGATAVETALVLPLVAVFLFGILQVSLAFYELSMTQNSLEDAAREILILNNPTDAEVESTANAAIHQSQNASIVLTTTFVNQFGSDYAQLNAAFNYSLDIPFTDGISVSRTLGTEIILQR